MIDSGRFVVTHNETEAVNDDPMEDHSLTDAANAGTEWGLSQAFSQSTLFDLGQIDVRWDEDLATLWAFMTPLERPNSNLGLMRDTMAWQRESRRVFGDNGPLKFMVLGSRFPGVFNLGGDLEMFAECIQRRDRETLLKYGVACCEIVDRIWHCNDMNIINIGLAQGDALG
ncbi:MAG: enoyl-CoA hydratase, partial [Pseudomonadota bacterium]|nr:enoyl-CoA hydratase [Pseudomonadota bacterium]